MSRLTLERKSLFPGKKLGPKKVFINFLSYSYFFHILGMIMSRVILFTGLKRRKFFKICPGMVLTTSLNMKPQRGTRRCRGTWYYNNYKPKSNRYALILFIKKSKRFPVAWRVNLLNWNEAANSQDLSFQVLKKIFILIVN